MSADGGAAAGPRRGRRPSRAQAKKAASPAPASAPSSRAPLAPLLPGEVVPAELVAAFGNPVPADELVLWASLTPEGRSRALARLEAVRAWDLDATAGSAEAIARGLGGMSRSRFYRMVSDWRSRPSLASLGAKPSGSKPRGPKAELAGAHEALQKALPGVVGRGLEAVGMDADRLNVSALVRELRGEAAASVPRLPGDTTLRAMVEREVRRRSLVAKAGHEVVFDFCAVGVPGTGGVPHVMFACVDKATRFVFGIAIGDADASRSGYRAAARDAIARLGVSSRDLGWAPTLVRAQITRGTDGDGWDGFFATVGREVGADVNEKGGGVRFGTDLRRLLGDALGTVRLLPLRPGPLEPLRISVVDATFTAAEARTRMEAELARHNAGVLAELGGGAGTPPPGLVVLLRMLAD